MLNYYIIKTEGKYLKIDGDKPRLVDKNSATKFKNKTIADYNGDKYCKSYEIEDESYDK